MTDLRPPQPLVDAARLRHRRVSAIRRAADRAMDAWRPGQPDAHYWLAKRIRDEGGRYPPAGAFPDSPVAWRRS